MTTDRPHDREGRAAGPARGRFVDASPASRGRPGPVIPRQPDAASPRTATPATDAVPAPAPPPAAGPGRTPDGADGAFGGWLDPHRVEVLAAEWQAVQAGFVDDPAGAVERADELVCRVADLVAAAVRERREALHAGPGSPAATGTGTEELRLALRDYRSVLDRLLAS